VELLIAANHDKCASWLGDVEKGKRKDVSMGFDCEEEVCQIKGCGHRSRTRKERCEHTKKGAKAPFGMGRILEDGQKIYVDNPKGVFNDISDVPIGADRIAQSLRKVGSLGDNSDEVVCGAQLAEEVYKIATLSSATKIAIAHKCSRMEKRIGCVGFVPDKETVRITKKVAGLLREVEPGTMFSELALTGSVLGFRDFFKLAIGENYPEVAAFVDLAEPHCRQLFSNIVDDPDRLSTVACNSTYDCFKSANRVLDDFGRAQLAAEFSIDPDIAVERLTKQAIGSSSFLPSPLAAPTAPELYLLNEYAAYKLAALEGVPMELSDPVVMTAVMTL